MSDTSTIETLRDLADKAAEKGVELHARVHFLADELTAGQRDDLLLELVRQSISAVRFYADEIEKRVGK